jgi:hypothetical protein
MLITCKANEEQDARSGNSYLSNYTNSFNLYILLTKHTINVFFLYFFKATIQSLNKTNGKTVNDHHMPYFGYYSKNTKH